MSGFMLDTNVFDALLDTGAASTLNLRTPIYVTHIQRDELEAIPERRSDAKKALLQLCDEIPTGQLPTHDFVLDTSRLGHARLSDGEGLATLLGDRSSRHLKDMLIARTALELGLTLVSDDARLRGPFGRNGGRSITSAEFFEVTAASSDEST